MTGEPSGDDEHGARVSAVENADDIRGPWHILDQVEVPRVDEGRNDVTTRAAVIVVLDRKRDVAYIEVERVAVEQKKERRHEQQDHERATVPAHLPEFLDRNGDRLHARPLRSAMSRNTSSSDGATT